MVLMKLFRTDEAASFLLEDGPGPTALDLFFFLLFLEFCISSSFATGF